MSGQVAEEVCGSERRVAEPPPRETGHSRWWATCARAAAAALLCAAAVSGAQAQSADILPRTGALTMAGDCSLTLDGALYSRCECRMMITAAGGQHVLSGLNVGCDGRAGQAGALSGLVGSASRSIRVLYDHGPTTGGGSGMWLTSEAAELDNVLADESWLLLTLRLAGPTHFENSFGKACVDGTTGARC